MKLRILTVGDVVGSAGLAYLGKTLRALKREKRIDFCVVNGENASMVGMTPRQADDIFFAGADVITLGNHIWNRREIIPYLEDTAYVLRPANLAPQLPGIGYHTYDTVAGPLAVINLVGRCGMDFGPDNPFLMVAKLVKALAARLDEQPETRITYFQPDARKAGGAYCTVAGPVKNIDLYTRAVVMASGQRIAIDEIVQID